MIRKAEEKDIPQVAMLLGQVLEVHAEGRPDIFISGTRKYTDRELCAIFNDGLRPVFVWTDENDVAWGYAFCILEETKGANNLRDMKSVYIDDICVDREHRRRGIAGELYAHVLAFAREQGCYHVTLNVWELNPGAKAFYEKMGMRPLKTVMETIL